MGGNKVTQRGFTPKRKQKLSVYILSVIFVTSYCVFLSFVFSGCIRLQGKAGYWHRGTQDEQPKYKQVGFDTQDLVQSNQAPGSITY